MPQSRFSIPPGSESQVSKMNPFGTIPECKTQSLEVKGSNQAESLFTLDERNRNGLKGSVNLSRIEPIEPQETKWGHNHEFSDPDSDDSCDHDHFHTVGPSQLRKFFKRFDGSWNPYDHVA